MKTLKCARNLLILVLLFISMLFLCSLPAREDAFAEESDAHVHTDHDGWTEVTPLVGGLVGGEDGQPARYYLDGDVVLEDTLSVSGNVVLCLGGHKLSVLQGTDTGIICVKEGAALTLCDCNGETEHTYYIDNSGLPVFFEGEIPDDAPAEAMVESVSGGIIAGGYGSAGGGIVIEGATVCMYGGTIVGNFSEQYGGGIYMNGANSRLEMFGGSICRNSAKSRGGGVYVCENGQFVMNGGTLSSNVAETEGGGVFIDIGGDFTLSGGLITGNSAVDGGGIYSYGRQYFGGGEVFIDGGEVCKNISSDGAAIKCVYGDMTVHGGYFDEEIDFNGIVRTELIGGYYTNKYPMMASSGCDVYLIDETFGDSDYREEYPYAIYKFGYLEVEVSENIVYDGKCIAEGVDFTIFPRGLDLSYKYSFEYYMLDGLPVTAREDITVKAILNKSVLLETEEGKYYIGSGASETFTVTIAKATPDAEVPQGIEGEVGQALADISLPDKWQWDDPQTVLGGEGVFSYPATYLMNNVNYNNLNAMIEIEVTGGEPPGGETEEPDPPAGGETEEPDPPAGGETEEPDPPAGGETEEFDPPAGGETEEPDPPAGDDDKEHQGGAVVPDGGGGCGSLHDELGGMSLTFGMGLVVFAAVAVIIRRKRRANPD